MKQMLLSGGLLAGDFLTQVGEFAARREVHETHYGLLALGLLGLLFSVFQFSRATAVAVIEHGESFTIEKKGFSE